VLGGVLGQTRGSVLVPLRFRVAFPGPARSTLHDHAMLFRLFDYGSELHVYVVPWWSDCAPGWGRYVFGLVAALAAGSRILQETLKLGGICVITNSLPFRCRKVFVIMKTSPIFPNFDEEFPFREDFAAKNGHFPRQSLRDHAPATRYAP
jgi:hypothetical protein